MTGVDLAYPPKKPSLYYAIHASAYGPNPFGPHANRPHGKVSYLYKDMNLKELSIKYPLRKIHGPIPTRNWFVGKTFKRSEYAEKE